MDYLVSEVLDHQPPGVRSLLLNTAILHRFCAPLCEALGSTPGTTEKNGMTGQAFIQFLRENNLFVIPLDTEDRWFRYHRLYKTR
jgi:LuxR family maltose regulon positive regulatory protein